MATSPSISSSLNSDGPSDGPAAGAPEIAIGKRPFFGKPFLWLLFSIALLLVPAIGYLLQADMAWEEIHPALNAMLNGTSAVFLIAGYLAVKKRHIELHVSSMIAALVASTLFLISYLLRYYISGTHRYPGDGADKAIYLFILFTHMILATAVIPMVLRAVYLAWRKRYAEHRKIARITWPVWIYVSVTGVIVYLMLYPLANALYAAG